MSELKLCEYCGVNKVKRSGSRFCSRACANKGVPRFPWLCDPTVSHPKPQKGKKDPSNIIGRRKNKTYDEIYGVEKSNNIRNRQSNKAKNIHPKGISFGERTQFKVGHTSICTEAGNKKISEKLTKYNALSETKNRKSEELKQRILNGSFTPAEYSYMSISGFRKDLGHFVRSSWEANICRILKHKNIFYEYESKCCRFKVKDSIYIIDLFLPNYNRYIEIRPLIFINKNSKIKDFKKLYPDKSFYVLSDRIYKWLVNRYKEEIKAME